MRNNYQNNIDIKLKNIDIIFENCSSRLNKLKKEQDGIINDNINIIKKDTKVSLRNKFRKLFFKSKGN